MQDNPNKKSSNICLIAILFLLSEQILSKNSPTKERKKPFGTKKAVGYFKPLFAVRNDVAGYGLRNILYREPSAHTYKCLFAKRAGRIQHVRVFFRQAGECIAGDIAALALAQHRIGQRGPAAQGILPGIARIVEDGYGVYQAARLVVNAAAPAQIARIVVNGPQRGILDRDLPVLDQPVYVLAMVQYFYPLEVVALAEYPETDRARSDQRLGPAAADEFRVFCDHGLGGFHLSGQHHRPSAANGPVLVHIRIFVAGSPQDL